MNCFIHFELSKTKADNTDFRIGKPVHTPSDWTGHVTSSANHCTRIPVLSKAIMNWIEWNGVESLVRLMSQSIPSITIPPGNPRALGQNSCPAPRGFDLIKCPGGLGFDRGGEVAKNRWKRAITQNEFLRSNSVLRYSQIQTLLIINCCIPATVHFSCYAALPDFFTFL